MIIETGTKTINGKNSTNIIPVLINVSEITVIKVKTFFELILMIFNSILLTKGINAIAINIPIKIGINNDIKVLKKKDFEFEISFFFITNITIITKIKKGIEMKIKERYILVNIKSKTWVSSFQVQEIKLPLLSITIRELSGVR